MTEKPKNKLAELLKKHASVLRFLIVGGTNTLLDFILLFLFVGLGVDKIAANYISTGAAMVFSFFANKSFTFKDKTKKAKRQFALFFAVTIAGMWGLQPLIIWLVTSSLESYITNSDLNLFIAKVIATVATLVWNYLLYSRLVFKKESITS